METPGGMCVGRQRKSQICQLGTDLEFLFLVLMLHKRRKTNLWRGVVIQKSLGIMCPKGV